MKYLMALIQWFMPSKIQCQEEAINYQQPFSEVWDRRVRKMLESGTVTVGHCVIYANEGEDKIAIWAENYPYSCGAIESKNGVGAPIEVRFRPSLEVIERINSIYQSGKRSELDGKLKEWGMKP